MLPEQRKRAGLAVECRLSSLRTTAAAVARRAGVDPKTVRNLINGTTWPNVVTRQRIETALHWPPGEIMRQAVTEDTPLASFTSKELLIEILRRMDNPV